MDAASQELLLHMMGIFGGDSEHTISFMLCGRNLPDQIENAQISERLLQRVCVELGDDDRIELLEDTIGLDSTSAHLLDEAVTGAGRRSLLARHHTEGVFLLETVFGAVITNSERRVVPVRVIAEFHINNELSRIPPVSEILQGIESAPWMMRVARPSRLIMRSLQETS